MRHLAALLLTLATLPALAEPGFFRPTPMLLESPTVDAAKVGFSCSILLRYNAPQAANSLELTYIGGSFCVSTQEAAINAAAASKPGIKVSNGGEPALAPVYQCSIAVNYEPATASTPDLQYTGVGCEATQGAVLHIAVSAVACGHRATPCRP